jgi:hypothetical protein
MEKVGDSRGNHGVIRKVLTTSSIKPHSSPLKKEWFTQDMYSKIPTTNMGWYFPISKPCSRASDPHISVK